jgi:heme-degrading monooxygenase HmoA
MYASLTTFKTAPGKRAECEGLADKLFPIMKGMKGFKSVVYFGDSDNNVYGTFYTWETKEDLEAAYNLIQPKLQEALGPLVIEPPVRKIYEVYEPKA